MKPLAVIALMLSAAFVAAPYQTQTLTPADLQNLPLAGSTVTLRSTTRMVDVSAVVVDKKGNPVTDLKKEDFQIFDEGKRQTIRLFTPPASAATAAAASSSPQPEAPPAAPGVFSNRVEQGSRPSTPTVILFDEGFGKWEEKGFGRDRLIRFLKEQPAGEQIGIYLPIPNGVGIVRDLTRDNADLVKIIQDWGFGPLSVQTTATLDRLEQMNNVRLFDPHYCTATNSLRALTATANHVAGVAGRKTLIWFSQGVQPGIGMPNCFQEEQEAQQALNKANMTLYAIDFRGLQSVQPDAAIGSKQLGCTQGCDSSRAVTNTVTAMTRSALDTIEQGHQLMLDMAEKTGGRAYLDGNDILAALRAPAADADSAYALGFYPDSPHLDGSYHELTVKLPERPDLTVRYRRGYVDESVDPKAQLRTALWSPLDTTAIALTAELVPTDAGAYDVKLNIGIGGLDLAQRSGRWQGKIHVIFAQKDQNGRQYDYRDDTVQIDLKPDTYQTMRKSGLAYRQALRPNPKAVSLRVVVRDDSGNLGSVTIPLIEHQTQLIRR